MNIKNTPIFYINLNSNKKRKDLFEKNIHSLRLTAQRIEAINGLRLYSNAYVNEIASKLEVDPEKIKTEYFTNRKNFSTLSLDIKIILPKVGCLLSHLLTIKKAYDQQLEHVLICEDDAVLLPDILKRKIELPSGTDIFYLGLVQKNGRNR